MTEETSSIMSSDAPTVSDSGLDVGFISALVAAAAKHQKETTEAAKPVLSREQTEARYLMEWRERSAFEKPADANLSPAFIKAIKSDIFVDLTKLAAPNEKEDTPEKRFGPLQWSKGFTRYALIRGEDEPWLYREMMIYLNIVNTMAADNSWTLALEYDRNFRQNRGAPSVVKSELLLKEYPWGKTHLKSYMDAALALQLKKIAPTKRRSEEQGGASGSSGEKRFFQGNQQEKICINYTRGRCSYGDRCKYKHPPATSRGHSERRERSEDRDKDKQSGKSASREA